MVVSIKALFHSSPTLFYLSYSSLERLRKPASLLGYILEFEASDDRTSFVSGTHQDGSEPNYDVKVKCGRQTVSM